MSVVNPGIQGAAPVYQLSTPTFVTKDFTMTASGPVIVGMPNLRIKVYFIKMYVGADTVCYWRVGSTPTEGAILYKKDTVNVENVVYPSSMFITEPGENVNLVITSGGPCKGRICYWLDDIP
jgi:hypothetical protein